MHDFLGDRRVDPLSHYEYSFSGMRSVAVASATKAPHDQSFSTYATNFLNTTVALLLPNPNALIRATFVLHGGVKLFNLPHPRQPPNRPV